MQLPAGHDPALANPRNSNKQQRALQPLPRRRRPQLAVVAAKRCAEMRHANRGAGAFELSNPNEKEKEKELENRNKSGEGG